MRRLFLLLLALAIALLPACGAAPDETLEDGEDIDTQEEALVANLLDADEIAFLSELNAYRVSKGLSKVRVSIALTRAANAHSKDMAANTFMSHTSSDGTSTGTRIKKYYPYNTGWGEIIAYGYTTGAQVFQAWKNSPSHDAVMRGDYLVVGISRVLSAANNYYYWTADFGGYRDAVLSAGFGTIASNGGFESTSVTTGVKWSAVTALNKWHLFAGSGGSSAIKIASANTGTYGLRNVDPDPGMASATQLVKAAANVNYGVAVNTRRISGSTAQAVYLDFLDKDHNRIDVFTVSTGTSTSWTKVATKATSPSGTKYVRVILYGSGADGKASTFDYDGVTVTAE
jgi:uncharacterized protein YkwD